MIYIVLATIGAVLWLAFTPHQANNPQQHRKRFGIALAIAFLQGISLGPLLKMTLSFDAGNQCVDFKFFLFFFVLSLTRIAVGSFLMHLWELLSSSHASRRLPCSRTAE
jgi:hypothetical protein